MGKCRKNKEEERKFQELFSSIYDSSSDAIGYADLEGHLLDVNSAFSHITGYCKDELLAGKRYQDITPPEYHEYEAKKIEELLKTGKPQEYEKEYIRKDGSRIPLLLTTFLVKNPDGKTIGIAAIIKDISERKKTEEELRKAYNELKETHAQLIQSEKLASIGRMVAGVAHEINNPLAVISGEAEMLLRDKGKDEEIKDASRIIVEQSKRIKAIIKDLLGFSRRKETELKPLDINDVVKDSTSLLGYQTHIKNVQIMKELDPNLPDVLADKGQIQEVFLNIMLNAVEAMEGKGSLTIRTHSEKIEKYGRRRTDKFKFGQEIVVIEFEDTGKGMDEEALKKIFDPFFTTKEGNVGLGLSICYGIMENHNGLIEASSKLGKGSIFIVKLPVFSKEGEG